jgi:hypothetical protein
VTKPTPNDVLLKAVERASRLHRIARMKRDAIEVVGETATGAGDRAGLEARFNRALMSLVRDVHLSDVAGGSSDPWPVCARTWACGSSPRAWKPLRAP